MNIIQTAMSEPVRRAVIVLGALILLGGVLGLVASSGQSLTEARGARVVELMHLNPLGSWISIGLGAIAIAAGILRSHLLALIASAGLLVCVVLVTFGANRPTNALGGTASTVGFHLGPAAGLLILSLAEHAAQQTDVPSEASADQA